ncbi:galactose-1-phosphate uridylyltransferase [Deinococcus peraridilitoris]|uniref:Galactose-1-phosphate uridylyltransferase n=1 Tax=Deinococcus peraridilitoris (strain DSM 19664 / LMG 22246 / CIP 109416 / KR-200) TaxID=937777 RepID=K9ZYD5_DEIPD|nr:galactose-1-phosphate uridylyltransferase [Deinococcus peraridilitoris]AFZ65952.1 galactose-1-phosphate uridylyltransferase, family 1 [Deinococcus peraridilitoris DSM 19664]
MPTTDSHRHEYLKPDGRKLWLYGRQPFQVGEIPSPDSVPVTAHPYLRWHPLRGEWVIYAAHRQNRTFLPPPDYNPLAPTREGGVPTELPQGGYDIAVFENRFPSLVPHPGEPPRLEGVVTAPGEGACEVVVFTQDPEASLGSLPIEHVALLIDVWADRTRELGRRDEITYVLPFENRGVEVGVTLHHPHGQIYAYSSLPPIQVRALEHARAHFARTGENLGLTLVNDEIAAGTRIVRENEAALSFVPPFARYTYETWLMPKRPVAFLSDLSPEERLGVAELLKDTLQRLDALFGVRMPYLMTLHQAPTDGTDYPEWPLRFEFYPALRAPGKLKFLAGTELGAGVFANDALPEDKARELREVQL